MKSIFISRDLKANSFFKKELEAAGFTIHGKSLLKFSATDFKQVPKSNWIFFYSKNGVKFFFQRLKKLNRSIPKQVLWAAMGKGTAKALLAKTGQVDFTGGGNTLGTAMDFLEVANGRVILFPQAERSRQTIQRLLADNIIAKNLVVYKNEIKKQVPIPDCDALVFTSPMNVNAYFEKKALSDNQKIYAIGRTTAKTLVSLGIEDFKIAEEPSEIALVKSILEP